jgi:hypothetical protein
MTSADPVQRRPRSSLIAATLRMPEARQASKMDATRGFSSPAQAGRLAKRQAVVRTPWLRGKQPVRRVQKPGSVDDGRSV